MRDSEDTLQMDGNIRRRMEDICNGVWAANERNMCSDKGMDAAHCHIGDNQTIRIHELAYELRRIR
jgi:hypothetical protein